MVQKKNRKKNKNKKNLTQLLLKKMSFLFSSFLPPMPLMQQMPEHERKHFCDNSECKGELTLVSIMQSVSENAEVYRCTKCKDFKIMNSRPSGFNSNAIGTNSNYILERKKERIEICKERQLKAKARKLRAKPRSNSKSDC